MYPIHFWQATQMFSNSFIMHTRVLVCFENTKAKNPFKEEKRFKKPLILSHCAIIR